MDRGVIPDLDSVWNLVLACRTCNRGEKGKFARVPALHYLERLSARGEYLIASHHPLRETLIRLTGNTVADRKSFLELWWRLAFSYLHHPWSAEGEVATAW